MSIQELFATLGKGNDGVFGRVLDACTPESIYSLYVVCHPKSQMRPQLASYLQHRMQRTRRAFFPLEQLVDWIARIGYPEHLRLIFAPSYRDEVLHDEILNLYLRAYLIHHPERILALLRREAIMERRKLFGPDVILDAEINVNRYWRPLLDQAKITGHYQLLRHIETHYMHRWSCTPSVAEMVRPRLFCLRHLPVPSMRYVLQRYFSTQKHRPSRDIPYFELLAIIDTSTPRETVEWILQGCKKNYCRDIKVYQQILHALIIIAYNHRHNNDINRKDDDLLWYVTLRLVGIVSPYYRSDTGSMIGGFQSFVSCIKFDKWVYTHGTGEFPHGHWTDNFHFVKLVDCYQQEIDWRVKMGIEFTDVENTIVNYFNDPSIIRRHGWQLEQHPLHTEDILDRLDEVQRRDTSCYSRVFNRHLARNPNIHTDGITMLDLNGTMIESMRCIHPEMVYPLSTVVRHRDMLIHMRRRSLQKLNGNMNRRICDVERQSITAQDSVENFYHHHRYVNASCRVFVMTEADFFVGAFVFDVVVNILIIKNGMLGDRLVAGKIQRYYLKLLPEYAKLYTFRDLNAMISHICGFDAAESPHLYFKDMEKYIYMPEQKQPCMVERRSTYLLAIILELLLDPEYDFDFDLQRFWKVTVKTSTPEIVHLVHKTCEILREERKHYSPLFETAEYLATEARPRS